MINDKRIIDLIKEDNRRLTAIDKETERLKEEKDNLRATYEEEDTIIAKRFNGRTVSTKEEVKEEIIRGLAALGKVHVTTDEECGRVDFRIQGGDIYPKRSRTSCWDGEFFDKLFKFGKDISKNIKNKELKKDFDTFYKYLKANEKAINKTKDSDAEEWFEISQREVVINQDIDYNSDYSGEDEGHFKFSKVNAISIAIEVDDKQPKLMLRYNKKGEKVIIPFYQHVVDQLKPELAAFIEERKKLRMKNCKLQIGLGKVVDECFKKWFVLQEI